MDISDIRFAKSGDIQIAYQRYGSGPDVVLVPPIVSNVELGWEEETYRRVREHIGRHVRILEFDKRGIGSSDPFDEPPTLEQRMGDITAVMDAEGLERASVVGLSEGGLMAQVFAARFPERVDRLVLLNSLAGPSTFAGQKKFREPGDSRRTGLEIMSDFDRMAETWGREPRNFVDLVCPSQKNNDAMLRWIGRFQRQSTSPAGFRRQLESIVPLDASGELARIQAPTLVINVKRDRVLPPSTGRYLASRIAGARYVEFDGEDHYCWTMARWRDITDYWLEFITGSAPVVAVERRFATILFTDIVDSTSLCSELGNQEWRRLMERHDRLAASSVSRHGGRIVKNTGDGLLASFATPSAAIAFVAELREGLSRERIVIRAGVHAGEIELRDDGDVVGLAVSLAARVASVASPGSLFASSTVRDLLLGSGRSFEDRGEHQLKGIEGAWKLFEVAS
jgi:class 3 adenylate cyclase/pimeloyl-ACP methyl ester carboxylesterase